MKKMILMVSLLLLISCNENKSISSNVEKIVDGISIGRYLNQALPENVERFAKDIITDKFQAQNCLTISDTRQEIYYGLYNSINDINEVYKTTYHNGLWSDPEKFYPFHEGGISIDAPFFSPDSKRLYFLARDTKKESIEAIWYVDLSDYEPIKLPNIINDYEIHMQFSVADDYSLYFKSKHESSLGESDLYVSRYGEKYQEPIQLSSNINTPYNEMTPYIAPDQTYLLFSRNKTPDGYGGADLYISFKENGQFSSSRLLKEGINKASNETCPIISPDGNYLFFNSDRLGRFEIYWTQFDLDH